MALSINKVLAFMAVACSMAVPTVAQEAESLQPFRQISYQLEMQAGISNGTTPLWLNANKHGLSSLEKENGYMRAGVVRPVRVDSARRWGIGYGLDVAVPYHYTSHVVVQQAFAELRWWHGTLSVGSKERPMELKNNELSSGSQTFGINARPIPQVRLSLEDYWTLPFGNGWLHLKGHLAYGKYTDDNWQHDFTQRQTKYTDGMFYHSKAGYLKIGNEEVFCPWSLEMGLEMGTQFGGTSYQVPDGKELKTVENGKGLSSFLHAIIPRGGETGEGMYHNIEGNHLGSWLLRLNYDNDSWAFGFYVDKFFEDHSGMFMVDYDGYGEGDEWNKRKHLRFFLHKPKDMMLGTELKLRRDVWVNDIVFEYLYSKYQSGPVYHDRTPAISQHVAGNDNYYNHYIYTGWQHWGQVMGNPLYRSPLYNTDGMIGVENNRFMAFHLGLSGNPTEQLGYRLLATYQDGLGTYANPYTKVHHNVSVMLEAYWRFAGRTLEGWSVRGGIGMDFGGILGNNQGIQLTIKKSGILAK